MENFRNGKNRTEVDGQTTLDPEFNLETAKKALTHLQESEGFDVNGAYLRGSSAYGLAINSDAAVYRDTGEEASDVDLTVIVEGDHENNPDYVSDAYDKIDEFNEEHPDLAELEPGIVDREKFEGALTAAGADFAEDGTTSEYIIISYPGKGEKKYEYEEFIKSLEERVLLGEIGGSRIEKELKAGSYLLDEYGFELESLDEYMEEACLKKEEIMEENMDKSEKIDLDNRHDDIKTANSDYRAGETIKSIIQNNLDIKELAKISRGTFGEIAINNTGLGGMSINQYIADKISKHESVNANLGDDTIEYVIGSERFDEEELGIGTERILKDSIKGELGRIIGEIDIKQNPNEMTTDEIIESYVDQFYGGGIDSF